MSVWDRGNAVPAKAWREAVACGDMLDRLPCKRCGATRLSACTLPLSKDEIRDVVDFVNGYGWDAAHELAGRPA